MRWNLFSPSPQSFDRESFVWTLSFRRVVTSVIADELLALEEFPSVRQSFRWFLPWGPSAQHLPGPAGCLCGHGGSPAWLSSGYFALCPKENILFHLQTTRIRRLKYISREKFKLYWFETINLRSLLVDSFPRILKLSSRVLAFMRNSCPSFVL